MNRPGAQHGPKHLVLVGMRAAGKTSMGTAAAGALQKRFIDLDHVLEQEVFGSTINAFVDKNGWPAFRAAEAQLLADVLQSGKHLQAGVSYVIATGGGIVETDSARDMLAEFSPVLWVDRHIDDIVKTLEGAGAYRPGLGTPPRDVYAKRRPMYDACSDYVITMRPGDENWPALERRFVELCKFAEHVEASGAPPAAPCSPVCVPITAPDPSKAAAEIAEAGAEGAGMVELRLDKIGTVEQAAAALPQLLAAARRFGLLALATVRPTWEDPHASYAGPEEPRLGLLKRAASLGASFVDVEQRAIPAFRRAGGLPEGSRTRLVVSSHDFTRLHGMDELRALEAAMRASAGPAGVVKIAQMAPDCAAAARMLALLEECRPRPTVLLAMGAAGVFTRLLAPRCGGAFTFGALAGPGRASAPGQPTARDMWDTYRLDCADSSTRVFAAIGSDAATKAAMLNAAFCADACNAISMALPVEEGSLPDLLGALPPGLLDGVSAALSGATPAWKVLAECDDSAKKSGVADTVLLQKAGPGYTGYDTAGAAPPATRKPCSFCAEGVAMLLTRRKNPEAAVMRAISQYRLFKGSDVMPATAQAMRKAAAL